MSILEISTGKKKQPINVVLCGGQGVGKTTWGAMAPRPVFVGAEETGEMDIARFPKPKTFAELMQQIDHLIKNKGLGYESLVVDTLDSVESLVHREILDSDPKKTGSMIAALGGYGKAYGVAETRLLEMRDRFVSLRDEYGMNIIMLAHIKKVQAVDAMLALSYDTYELAMHARAQAVFTDWASAVLFATYIVHPTAGTGTDRIFASGEGKRVMLTEKRPSHLAKNRFSLPYEMDLDFTVFKSAVDKFYESGPTAQGITNVIVGLCENVDQDLKVKVMAQVESAKGSLPKLQKIETRLREVIQNGVSANA